MVPIDSLHPRNCTFLICFFFSLPPIISSADPGTAYHDPADATDRHAMDMANGHADIDGFGTDDHDDDTAEYEHNAEDDDDDDNDDDDDDKPWHSEL
jgi:hypothetical protein